ncbi:MAG TPA: carotenoid oxygenase family protein [Crinalium sp.]|jgi:all-trans-8'-apo-beta-carotenal 15,15'-oxygenase
MQNVQLQDSALDSHPSYDVQGWQKGYRSLRDEFDYWIDEIEGKIPAGLHGTLFRNGPGLFDRNGHRVQHPFDGDGMVCAIAISEGRAHFRNRYVRTEGYVAEQQADKYLYRGVFGTQKPGGWLANAFDMRIKNIANTNVIYWGGKLLALWEAADPYRLDPKTLETLGTDDLDSVLQSGAAFSAHPRVDPACDRDGGAPCLVNFSVKPGLSSKITIYELDGQGKVTRQHARTIPGFAFLHDFAITPNYCIFVQNAVTLNPLPYALGFKGAGECLSFDAKQPSQIIVIPRDPSQPIKRLSTQAGFIFHHANAFEQGDTLCLDSICYDGLPVVEPGRDYLETNFAALSPGQFWRFRINLKHDIVDRQLLEHRCCEFPTLHPDYEGRPYRYVYLGAAHTATGNAPLQAILKMDVESGDRQLWSAAPWGYAGEPVFVPRPDARAEDDGWLLTLVFNAKTERSQLVILDARDLNRGPLAQLHLKHHVPYGLHGNFTPEYFGP